MVFSTKKRGFQKHFAEFFAGIGLMRMGLEQAGWEVKFANDIDPMKNQLYDAHFQDQNSHFTLGDIHVLNPDVIPDVSLATASFPCTDLSLAGRQVGLNGSQSSAFWGFVHILEKLGDRQPPIILLENVFGFLTSHKGKDLENALKALNRLGYSVDAFIVDALHFVPQSRVRLFVVGHKNARVHSILEEQLSLFYESELRPKKLVDFILRYPEIHWNIRELPGLPKRKSSLPDIVDNTPDHSGDWWSEERVEYLINQTSRKHRQIVDELTGLNKYSYLTAFRRVRKGRSMAEIRADGVAGCLRTPKGGSARQILLKVGHGQVKVRFMSPQECAKLMGADDYHITGTTSEALFGFGDAVCVPVVHWIAENYLNPLLEEINQTIIGSQSQSAKTAVSSSV